MNLDYKKQIVAFIDLLGFKQAVNAGQQELILNLLLSFANMRGEFKANIERSEDSVSYSITPEVSVFSDNLVLSIPLDDMENLLPESTVLGIMNSISAYIAYIAAVALESGFLIRGGIAKGKLFHKNGVVFGDALITAYKLESKVAIYPRVLVSESVLTYGTAKEKNLPLHSINVKTDFDGLPILDYISSYDNNIIRAGLQNSAMQFNNPDKYWLVKNTKKRMDKFSDIIIRNKIAMKNDIDILKKWLYFEKEYEIIKAREQEIFTTILSSNPDLSNALLEIQ